MRFTKTLLLALSAIAVRSAVVPETNNAQTANTQANTQNTNAQTTQNTNTQTTQNTNTQNTNTQSNSNQLTPEAQCVINSNCNQDVACIARCYGVPAPTNDMVFQTNDCALKCPDPAVDNSGYLKCYNECVDNYYMGNNLGAGTAATTGTNNNTGAQNTQNGNAQNGNTQNGNAQNGNNNANGVNNNGKLNNVNGTNANNNSTNANGNIKLNNGNNGNLIQESGSSTITMSTFAIAAAVLALLL
jgi:hypothetical protein